MWKRLQESQYYILFTKDFEYEICITDYVTIWTSIFSEKAFLAQLKDNNFGLELDCDGIEQENNKKFIEKGLYLLSNPEKLKKFNVVKEENSKSLKITMTMWFGYYFWFECVLSKGSEELFFHKVTHMLLKTVRDLRSSENELRRLLIKKDEEIEEYKCEGGEIVLRHLKTKAFNDKEHLTKHKLYEENFGSSDVPTDFIKTIDNTPKKNNIKQEQTADLNTNPVQVMKTEPTSQPNQDFGEPCVPTVQEPVKCEPDIKREIVTNDQRKRRKKFNI